jgi:hypothetical protein
VKKAVCLEIRGKHHLWSIDTAMSQRQIDDMRADGVEVGELIYTIPAWAVEMGLLRPWCFVQDVWNFRNPFG